MKFRLILPCLQSLMPAGRLTHPSRPPSMQLISRHLPHPSAAPAEAGTYMHHLIQILPHRQLNCLWKTNQFRPFQFMNYRPSITSAVQVKTVTSLQHLVMSQFRSPMTLFRALQVTSLNQPKMPRVVHCHLRLMRRQAWNICHSLRERNILKSKIPF
jgi:hypothetical protein